MLRRRRFAHERPCLVRATGADGAEAPEIAGVVGGGEGGLGGAGAQDEPLAVRGFVEEARHLDRIADDLGLRRRPVRRRPDGPAGRRSDRLKAEAATGEAQVTAMAGTASVQVSASEAVRDIGRLAHPTRRASRSGRWACRSIASRRQGGAATTAGRTAVCGGGASATQAASIDARACGQRGGGTISQDAFLIPPRRSVVRAAGKRMMRGGSRRMWSGPTSTGVDR